LSIIANTKSWPYYKRFLKIEATEDYISHFSFILSADDLNKQLARVFWLIFSSFD